FFSGAVAAAGFGGGALVDALSTCSAPAETVTVRASTRRQTSAAGRQPHSRASVMSLLLPRLPKNEGDPPGSTKHADVTGMFPPNIEVKQIVTDPPNERQKPDVKGRRVGYEHCFRRPVRRLEKGRNHGETGVVGNPQRRADGHQRAAPRRR